MTKAERQTGALRIEALPAYFNPSQEQIDTFARRLMPEIKRFFADKQIQQEFAEWQKTHRTGEN